MPPYNRVADVPAQLDQRRGRAAQQLLQVVARLDPRAGVQVERRLQAVLADDLGRPADALGQLIPRLCGEARCVWMVAAAGERLALGRALIGQVGERGAGLGQEPAQAAGVLEILGCLDLEQLQAAPRGRHRQSALV